MASSDFEEIVKRPVDESSGIPASSAGHSGDHDQYHDADAGVAVYDGVVDWSGGARDCPDDVAACACSKSERRDGSRLHKSLSAIIFATFVLISCKTVTASGTIAAVTDIAAIEQSIMIVALFCCPNG